MMTDPDYIKRAIELAGRGLGLVSPNPLVGAVVVVGNQVAGEGYHRYDTLKHAESRALEMAGARARGATLYCNLEPCCHQGRTPPCTAALIQAGISRAVISVQDPDPRVSGRGLEELRNAGIKVETGRMAAESRRLNEVYFKRVLTGLPFIHALAFQADARAGQARSGLRPAIPCPETRATSEKWQPSQALLETASTFDALVLGSVDRLNELFGAAFLSRSRHRRPVIAGSRQSLSRLESSGSLSSLSRVADVIVTGQAASEASIEDKGAADLAGGYEKEEEQALIRLLAERGVTSAFSLPGLSPGPIPAPRRVSLVAGKAAELRESTLEACAPRRREGTLEGFSPSGESRNEVDLTRLDKVTVIGVEAPEQEFGDAYGLTPAGPLNDVQITSSNGLVEITGYPPA